MMFLLGRQAMFGQDPPIYLRSITATRFPSPANVHAATVETVPPPRMTKSNSSGCIFWLSAHRRPPSDEEGSDSIKLNVKLAHTTTTNFPLVLFDSMTRCASWISSKRNTRVGFAL